ncbi:MAG: hypothetical protein GEV06_03300 [Luteitalea sp.]|nr:hypothetical protein [Luteitalea sp.]
MTNMLRFLLAVAVAVAAQPVPSSGAQPATTDNLILITLDGVRVEEMFGGLDLDVLRSTLDADQNVADVPVYRRFWADTPAARREKLMPFFWGTLMRQHGSIAGNPTANSSVTLTNTHRFSYPGYAEILLGEAHNNTIKSNDPVQNPYPTVLEEIKERLGLPTSRTGVFASWSVFNAIVEHTQGTLTTNAGFEVFDHPDPHVRELSALQFETPTPWDEVRHDVYTFRLAMAHLQHATPRILYLALGETDDWAHDGRYDRVLEACARTDRYLEALWTWLQAQPAYRDRTHILITTDHGRGRTTEDWRNHGATVDGAEDVWIAFVSPRMKQRGEWREHPPLHTNQVAATVAEWMGVDWKALRPSAGSPIR